MFPVADIKTPLASSCSGVMEVSALPAMIHVHPCGACALFLSLRWS